MATPLVTRHLHVARPSSKGVEPSPDPTRVGRRFVGRDADLGVLSRHLEAGAALVTLTGPAGVGKTALARRVAATRADATLCDLTTAHDAETLAARVLRALRLPGEPSTLVASLVARGPTFLVLDNFEHLAEHADATLGTWILQVPELQLLVTSRERLRLEGEVLHELAPLSLPGEGTPLEGEAASLWLARVREERAEYAPDAAEARQIAKLLRELDGLPLAIELAAARMGTLGVHEIQERIERRLDLLGNRTGTTLRSAIEGSWVLLDEAERDLLARCSVLRGVIAPAAAEALVDAEAREGTLDRLQSLREKSLLIRHDGGLGMLLSIRKLAGEKLEAAGHAEVTWQRHRAYYLAYAESCAALGPEQLTTATQRVEAERDNVLVAVQGALEDDVETALRILVAIDEPHWAHDGAPVSNLPWFDRALARSEAAQVDPRVLARALMARGRMAWRVGRFETSEHDVTEAVRLAVAAGDPALESLTLRFSSLTFLLRGQLDESERDANRAHALAVALDAPRLRGLAESMRVFVARLRGDQAAARRHIEDALVDFVRVGDLPFELSMRLEQMYVHLDAGELEAADRYAQLATALHERLGIPPSARLCFGLGLAALEAADPAEAELRFGEAVRAARTSGEMAWELSSAACKAIALFEQARWVEARIEYREMMPRGRAVGVHVYSALLAGVGALIESAVGHRHEAEELLLEAERNALSAPHRLGLALCRRVVEGEATATVRADLAILSRTMGAVLQAQGGHCCGCSSEPSMPVASCPQRSVHVSSASTATRAGSSHPSTPRVECGNRPVMRRLLLALAHARLENPPRILDADRLVAECWPGERIRPDAAKNRLHVMLTRVRALGLRDVIEGDDRGWYLGTDVVLG